MMFCPPTWYCPPPQPYAGTTLNPPHSIDPFAFVYGVFIALIFAAVILGGITALVAWLDPMQRDLRDPRKKK